MLDLFLPLGRALFEETQTKRGDEGQVTQFQCSASGHNIYVKFEKKGWWVQPAQIQSQTERDTIVIEHRAAVAERGIKEGAAVWALFEALEGRRQIRFGDRGKVVGFIADQVDCHIKVCPQFTPTHMAPRHSIPASLRSPIQRIHAFVCAAALLYR